LLYRVYFAEQGFGEYVTRGLTKILSLYIGHQTQSGIRFLRESNLNGFKFQAHYSVAFHRFPRRSERSISTLTARGRLLLRLSSPVAHWQLEGS